MEKWYDFPIQTTQNFKFKTPRRLIGLAISVLCVPAYYV